MQNLHDDKNIDKLSREAGEQFEADLTLHSWEQLQPVLNKELPLEKEKKRRLIFILFFFLLVGGGIVTSALWMNSQKTAEKQAVDTALPETASGTAANAQPLKEPQGNKTTTITNSNLPADKQVIVSNDKPGGKSAVSVPLNINVEQPILAGSRTGRREDRNNNQLRKNNNEPNQLITQDVVQQNPVIDQIPDNNKQDIIDNKQKAPQDKSDKPSVTTTDAQPDEIKENTAVSAKENNSTVEKAQPAVAENKAVAGKGKAAKQSRQPSVAASRWEFGAVFAPDISTVKFTHTQKPGTNIGIIVGYNISRRFTVQTGALYTVKNYKSRGEDYHPPKGYWTDYVKLETVAADCDMWDIPINLRYNVLPKKSSNLFITTGLSSYLMRKEDYDFFYYYNGNPVNRHRSYESESKHWFSVLNFSVGYERQISKNFSVQAEPFFKQPLKGVGFGNVKLNSTGIFFSVKYKPVSGKGR